MRLLLNLLIALYAVIVTTVWTLLVIVSIILFPIGHWILDTAEPFFDRLPEPKLIPAPPKMHCGPFYLPYWIRKILSKNHNSSCRLHDEAYNEQVTSRLEIDKLFLENMLTSVRQGRGTKAGAYISYWLVRYVVGWPSWYLIKAYKALGGKV